MIRALLAVLLLSGTAFGANSVSLVVRPAGGQIAVDINLANQDTVSGMQIPLDLHQGRLGLRVDSVSFVGSRCAHFFELNSRTVPEQDKVFLYLIETANPDLESSPLLPGSGRIATIYLTRLSQPQISEWRITNERVADEARDLSFLLWTNRAEEVPCEFGGATIRLSH